MQVATDGTEAGRDAPARVRHPGAFRHAVLAGPRSLSPQARAEIRALSGPRKGRFFLELAFTWTIIAAAITVGVRADNIFVTLACIFVIGTRQMILGLLMHEQVHRVALRGKYGDWWVNALAVWPLFATTIESYAKVHLSHHKYFFTQKDPDFLRKAGPDWTFPARWQHVLRMVLRDLTGLNTVALVRGKNASKVDEFNRPHPTHKWLRLAYYALAAAVLTWVEGWTVFLIYWLIPVLTTLQLMVRWLANVEHRYNIENGSLMETTPIVRMKAWQKLVIPDMNFGMHVYHHTHPGVSFANLPKVHEIYRREGLVDDSAVFNGAGAYLAFLVRRVP